MRLDHSKGSTRPFAALSAALLCQLSAGTLYWWPALVPELQQRLALSDPQATALVATANSGSLLGILGGFFHSRFGSRPTAMVGLLATSLIYLVLSRLRPSIHAFPLALALALAAATTAFMSYSSAVAAASSLFPRFFRGRVVGLCSALFGASSAVFAALQSAFFPSIRDTPTMMLVLSLYSLAVCVLVALVYPTHPVYLFPAIPSSYGTVPTLASLADHIRPNLNAFYYTAVFLILWLQLAALADVLDLSHRLLLFCAAAVLLSVLAILLLPIRTNLRVTPDDASDDVPQVQSTVDRPFRAVLTDLRYLYLALGFLVLVGGGVALLVQAQYLIAALPHANTYDIESVGRTSRVFVALFSAASVTARLATGAVMDRSPTPLGRHMRKYDLLLADSLGMGLGLLGLAFARSERLLYLPVTLVGLSYGVWMAASPALVTLWFGVQTFPRNFALLGPFVALASATLASTVPGVLREAFGTWKALTVLGGLPGETRRVCCGMECTAPTFCLLAVLQFGMFVLGRCLRSLVREKAEACGY